jgi:AAA family ATP:ADP antiporter
MEEAENSIGTRDDASVLERFLGMFGEVQPGEGKTILRLFGLSLLILQAYYFLRPAREAFILVEGSAELKIYLQGLTALVLIGVVPLYGLLVRHFERQDLMRWVIGIFIGCLGLFYVLARFDVPIAAPFYIWVSIFSVMMIAQFWSFCADLLTVGAGQRLFPVIAIGGSLGAVLGSRLVEDLVEFTGVDQLLPAAAVLLAVSAFLAHTAEKGIPEHCARTDHPHDEEESTIAKLLGGFRIVFKDRYLFLIATFVVILNWVSTTGEFILSDLVVAWAAETATDPDQQGLLIAQFFGNFFFWVNVTGLVIQAFFVSRIFTIAGVGGAVLVLPFVVMLGYLIILVVPIFAMVKLAKIAENGLNYSLRSTTHQALFLPTTRSAVYEAKAAIDTFCWRFGDFFAAVGVAGGIHLAGMQTMQFAYMNLIIVTLWLITAFAISRSYRVVMFGYHRQTIHLEKVVASQDYREETA